MILKRDHVADILIDALTELRFPLDDAPTLERGEVIPIATSLYSEPRCWVRVRGWSRDGDEMVVEFKRAPRPREPRGRFLARPRELPPADLRSHSGITFTEPELDDHVRDATALCDEPEMISRAISGKYGEQANGRNGHTSLRHSAAVEQARDARQTWTIEKRISVVKQRAKQQHVNVSGELHVIEQMLARARSGGRRLDAVTERIERVEALLDGVSEAA
jgi:hypothetical protein